MTELELILDLHQGSDRQGPGSDKVTRMALDCIDLPIDKTLNIADIGCGSGGQTITLARHTRSEITAVDLYPTFLEELAERAENLGFEQRITPLETSMDTLPFEKESIDIIWSEGAIYNIGFKKGINLWKEFLKPGGSIAVSEITWITNKRPKAVENFWIKEYPEIDIASKKISQLEKSGYSLTGYFYLSPDSWMDNYYQPLKAKFEKYLAKHQHVALAKKVVSEYSAEISFYKKYKDYFSYGFYIARKNDH